MKGCTELSPHPGITQIPKDILSPGCPLQQGAKLSADQGHAVQPGCLYPNPLRMLQKDRGNNVIPSPKTTSLSRAAKSRVCSAVPQPPGAAGACPRECLVHPEGPSPQQLWRCHTELPSLFTATKAPRAPGSSPCTWL